MRYLGNKKNLLSEIDNLIKAHCSGNCEIFCDAFCGTWVVWEFFKNKYSIIANDIQYYSFILSQAKLNSPDLKFKNLWLNPFDFFNNTKIKEEWFIYKNYSPKWGRMYFSEENALKIDFIRTKLEEWYIENKISDIEYYYLIACLLESVSKVANIAWVYGAFLKTRDPRAVKSMQFLKIDSKETSKKAIVYNDTIENLICNIEWDILYLDPPYTKNQYSVQYHLLETIAKYDAPIIAWKWWLRNTSETSSLWSREWDVHVVFEKIISNARFKHIILSYNSDWLMSKKFIEATLKRYWKEDSYELVKIPYKQYKNHQTWEKENHYEYLFYVEKKERKYVSYASPLNYQWWKYDLVDFIKSNLPQQKINTFFDVFWWWYNVWVNIDANKIVYNDINHKVAELIKTFYDTDLHELAKYIMRAKKQYKLEIWDKEKYMALRDKYNSIPESERDPKMLYMLILYWFNQQIRFNSSYDFNNPVWPTWLNDLMLEKLISFCSRMKEQNIEFMTSNFFDVNFYKENDFIYCDPPYLITLWSYNDWKRWFNWRSNKDEMSLYEYLEKVNKDSVKFMLSNVLEHRWKENLILKEWIKRNGLRVIEYWKNARWWRKEILVVNY